MRGAAAARRPPNTPQLTTPTAAAAADPWQFNYSRDSDSSFCSSRPSSAGQHRSSSAVPISDRSYQSAAVGTINSYLSSHSIPIQFKLKPIPSIKDVNETLRFLLSKLDYPVSNKIEDDVVAVLKFLNCPIKFNKSALRASTPHAFPTVLAVIHWLVQTAKYNDYVASSAQVTSELQANTMFQYLITSYLHYIRGDDDAMEQEDSLFMERIQEERNAVEEAKKALMENVAELERKLDALKKEKSPKEVLEEKRAVLERDVEKFHSLIEQLKSDLASAERKAADKVRELREKEEERRRVCEDNEALRKKVEEQGINSRDAERMKRELQVVERSIREAEEARTKWEIKCWDHDAAIEHEFKELEALQIKCNQAIRRLKLGINFHYELNANGSTASEVLGKEYKSTLKPALASFSDQVKKSLMDNTEELIALQQRLGLNAANIEMKRNLVAELQSRADEVANDLNRIRRETEEYISKCSMEAQKLVHDYEVDDQNMSIKEKETFQLLEASKTKLRETIKLSEEGVQACAGELLALVDSVSKHKEYMSSKILKMKNDLSETAAAVSDVHNRSLPANLAFADTNQ